MRTLLLAPLLLAAVPARATEPAEHKRLAERFDHLQHELTHRDAYNIDHRIERVLEGLGFTRENFQQPIEQLVLRSRAHRKPHPSWRLPVMMIKLEVRPAIGITNGKIKVRVQLSELLHI